MTKHLRLLLLLFLLTWPVAAQTSPGNIQPSSPAAGNAQNAVTANSNGTAFTVRFYGSAQAGVTIAGTATVNFEGQPLSGASWEDRYGYLKTDSTKTLVKNTTTSGTYFFDLAGDESFRARVSGCSACTVTVTIKGVPATARVGAPSGGGGVSASRTINTTSPITGGGDLSADRTIACATCAVTNANNNFSATQTVNLNAAAAPTNAGGSVVQLVGVDAANARFEADAFGAASFFTARRAGGTGASPTATPTTTQIGAFNWHGYDGAAWTGPQASISALTTQLFTSANQGTKVTISTTPNNSTTLTVAATFDQDQSTTLAGALKNASAKTLAWSNTLTLAGTDGTTQTFPSTSQSIPGLALNNTWTRGQTITEGTANESIVASTGYSLTGSNATNMIDFAGTWNTSGTPSAIKVNITNTASNAASRLLNIQQGGVDALYYDVAGVMTLASVNNSFNPVIKFFQGSGAGTVAAQIANESSTILTFLSVSTRVASIGGSTTPFLTVSSSGVAGFASSTDTRGTPDSAFSRISAGLIGVGTGAQGSFAGDLKLNNIIVTSTTDSTTTTTGAVTIAGGLAVLKRTFIPGITTSSGLQTAVLCQSSGGEMIADSVACLASSGRFKQDVRPLTVGLDEVMRLRPVSYRYKPEGIFSHNANYLRERVGFIAEDIDQVDSRLVGYEADGKTPRTVGYDQITPILVKSIQELKAEVDALRAEIQSLKQPRRIAFHLPSIIGL